MKLSKNIESYSSVQRMLNRLRAKARAKGRNIDKEPTSTLMIFPYYVQMFCEEIAEKDPDTLILERKQHLKSDDDFVRRQHEELTTDFINFLGGKGYSSNTISTALSAVSCLYLSNYVPLVDVIVPRGVPQKSYRLPSPEELKEIVSNAPLRTTTWISCQKDSGMGIGDLVNVTLEDESPFYGTVREQLKKGVCPIHLHVVRKKTMVVFDTFLGEDAVTMLNEYVTFQRGRIFNISERQVQNIVKDAGIKGGTHILRKFFNTYLKIGVASVLSKRGELEAVGLSDAMVESWMGHSLGRTKGAYHLPPVPVQREIYVEAYPRIKLP